MTAMIEGIEEVLQCKVSESILISLMMLSPEKSSWMGFASSF